MSGGRVADVLELDRDHDDWVRPRRSGPSGATGERGRSLDPLDASRGPGLTRHQMLRDSFHRRCQRSFGGARRSDGEQERYRDEEAEDKKGEGLASHGHGAFL